MGYSVSSVAYSTYVPFPRTLTVTVCTCRKGLHILVLVRQSAHLHVTRHKSPKLRYGRSYCYVGDSEVAYT